MVTWCNDSLFFVFDVDEKHDPDGRKVSSLLGKISMMSLPTAREGDDGGFVATAGPDRPRGMLTVLRRRLGPRVDGVGVSPCHERACACPCA